MKINKAIRIAVLMIIGVLTACGPDVQQAIIREPRIFDGQEAYADVLWQMEFGPRVPGTQAHAEVGDRIVEELAQAGWNTQVQNFQFEQTELKNIVASQGGPEQALVVLGAHYDTRPISDRDRDFPERPVPGANDGASGVAVLLELARSHPPGDLARCQVQLAFFDAEDSGGDVGWPWSVGARNFVESLDQGPESVVIVDMIGDADLEVYYEANSTPDLREEIWQFADELGYQQFVPEVRHSILDDHMPFLQEGIPAALLIDFDYPAWHTQQDTADKVSPQSLEAIGRTIQAWLQNRCG